MTLPVTVTGKDRPELTARRAMLQTGLQAAQGAAQAAAEEASGSWNAAVTSVCSNRARWANQREIAIASFCTNTHVSLMLLF